jgi:two-component system cell cycle response regulator DivK
MLENQTILLFEDNELNRKLVRAMLQKDKYQILEAEDAETGIQLAQEYRPDLILMDIQLPGMGGLSATRIIKKDRLLKGIPVIALTSYAMQGDEEEAREAGCDDYITKPIGRQRFLEAVTHFLKLGHV